MRPLVLLILVLATLLPSLALAYDVLVVQSRLDLAYEEVQNGFNKEQSVSKRVIALSDYAEVDLIRIVREDRPALILAVGDAALTATRGVRNTPVVAVMTLDIHNQKSSRPNMTGIGMFAAPEQYIDLFKSMKTRRVGVIYSKARSGWYLLLAQKAARMSGVELVTREVSTPRDTLKHLSTLVGKVDALWMLPDSTAVTRETTEAYFNFGQQEVIPVVSFATNYLGLGAAAVLEIDRFAIGSQAYALVAALLEDNIVQKMPIEFPKSIKLKTNPSVLKQLSSPLIARD